MQNAAEDTGDHLWLTHLPQEIVCMPHAKPALADVQAEINLKMFFCDGMMTGEWHR